MPDTHGTVIWTELMTRDVDAAKRYYQSLCGWTFNDMAMGPDNPVYTIAMRGDKPVIGMINMTQTTDDISAEPFWMSYFAVDDVDKAVEQTVAAGGEVKRAPFEIPNTGRIAIVRDPTGAQLGLMTPVPMPDA